VGASGSQPAAVLEKRSERGITEIARPGAKLEDVDSAEPLRLEQTGYQLQLDQVIGQLSI